MAVETIILQRFYDPKSKLFSRMPTLSHQSKR